MFKVQATLATIALVYLCGMIAYGEDAKVKETYMANAFALGRGLTSNLQITITRWTTEEEREALLKRDRKQC